MPVIIGTSGWQYPDWSGRLYPARLSQAEWLTYYSERFQTVEVNNTFYRLPQTSAFERWREQHPRRLRLQPQGQPVSHPRTPTAGAERTGEAAHDAGRSTRIQAGPDSHSIGSQLSRSTSTPCAVRSRPSRAVSGSPSNHAMSRGMSTRCGPRWRSTRRLLPHRFAPPSGTALAHGRLGLPTAARGSRPTPALLRADGPADVGRTSGAGCGPRTMTSMSTSTTITAAAR